MAVPGPQMGPESWGRPQLSRCPVCILGACGQDAWVQVCPGLLDRTLGQCPGVLACSPSPGAAGREGAPAQNDHVRLSATRGKHRVWKMGREPHRCCDCSRAVGLSAQPHPQGCGNEVGVSVATWRGTLLLETEARGEVLCGAAGQPHRMQRLQPQSWGCSPGTPGLGLSPLSTPIVKPGL